MITIAITSERLFDGEARAIVTLLDEGFDRVHLRKPAASRSEVEGVLRQIPADYLSHIVLHDHLSLALEYEVGGVHLNRRSPHPPCGYRGAVSSSCHSLAEVAEVSAEVDYLFLSPIFDSISKVGYESNFTDEELRESGLIGEKIVALGGVTPQNIVQVKELGFGGVALLGYIWSDLDEERLRIKAREIVELAK